MFGNKVEFCRQDISKKDGRKQLQSRRFIGSRTRNLAITSSLAEINQKYRVYTRQTKKRIAYLVLGSLCAFFCAYTYKIALIYCITQPMRRSLALLEIQTSFGDKLGFCKQLVYHNLKDYQTDNYCFPFKATLPFSQEGIYRSVDLIFTDVEEAFSTILSICFFYSLLFVFPLFLYHILCFFFPGLFTSQARVLCSYIVVWGSIVFISLWLIDFSLIPKILNFLYSFQINRKSLCLRAETKIYSYVSWCIYLYVLFLLILILSMILVEYREKNILQSIEVSCQNKSKSTLFISLKARANSIPWIESKYIFSQLETTLQKFFVVLAKTKLFGIKPIFLYNLFREKACQSLYAKIGSTLVEQKTKRCVYNLYNPKRGKISCLCLLVAAFVSPPDTFTQLSLALFLIVCNEILWGVSLVRAYRSYMFISG